MDPHKLLCVEEGCTREALHARYRTLCKLFHPDRNKNDPTAAIVFQLVHEAYERVAKITTDLPPIRVVSKSHNGKPRKPQQRSATTAAPAAAHAAPANTNNNNTTRTLAAKLDDPYFSQAFRLDEYFDDVPIRKE